LIVTSGGARTQDLRRIDQTREQAGNVAIDQQESTCSDG